MTREQNKQFIRDGLKFLRWTVFALILWLAMIQISDGAVFTSDGFDYHIHSVLLLFGFVYALKTTELLLLRGLLPLYRFRKHGPRPFQTVPHGSLLDFQISEVEGPRR